MEIVPAPQPTRRDLTVMQSILPDRVLLLPNLLPVRTGTPLTVENGAWRPIKPESGEIGLMFATNFGYGGENIEVARGLIVDTHARDLIPGRVKIANLGQNEPLRFVNDPEGSYLALTRSRVLLG